MCRLADHDVVITTYDTIGAEGASSLTNVCPNDMCSTMHRVREPMQNFSAFTRELNYIMFDVRQMYKSNFKCYSLFCWYTLHTIVYTECVVLTDPPPTRRGRGVEGKESVVWPPPPPSSRSTGTASSSMRHTRSVTPKLPWPSVYRDSRKV